VGIQQNEEKLIRAGQRGTSRRWRRSSAAIIGAVSDGFASAGEQEDAEDALQDGLLSRNRNLKRFEGRRKFSTWLTRIVINAALMRRRSAKARPAVSLDETPREEELPARSVLPRATTVSDAQPRLFCEHRTSRDKLSAASWRASSSQIFADHLAANLQAARQKPARCRPVSAKTLRKRAASSSRGVRPAIRPGRASRMRRRISAALITMPRQPRRELATPPFKAL